VDLFSPYWTPVAPVEAGRNRLTTAGGKQQKAKRRRGRPIDTDLKEEKRIVSAWESGKYNTYAELARELGTTKRVVKLALDRHRQRMNREKKSPRTNSSDE
jgi:hypothetical protein